jgi:hypothetical protein
MRQQLRLRVLVPVAVLGLLGVGFGAFAMGGPAPAESIPVSSSSAADTGTTGTGTADTGVPDAAPTTTQPAPAPAPAPAPSSTPKPKPQRKTPLEQELDAHGIVVVVFHTRGADLDATALREARAGAAAVDSGFLAVDVEKEGDVAELAAEYEVLGAPTVLVLAQSGEVRSRFDGYVDRETVAQAVTNARK